MGKVKIDLFKKQVLYDQAFDLGTPDGVLRFLKCYHELKARRDEGDLEASILIMDFLNVWQACADADGPLTFRERMIIYYVYALGLPKSEVAQRFNITLQTLRDHEKRAAKKLAYLIGGRNDRIGE